MICVVTADNYVAHRLGKSFVMGCTNMECKQRRKTCAFNQITLEAGDHISIDGLEGYVFEGFLKVLV